MRRSLRRTTRRTLLKSAFSRSIPLLATLFMAALTALTGGEALAQASAQPKAPAADAGSISPQMTDGTVNGQFGDWQIVCKPPPTGAKNEVCALVQSVTAEDRNNVGLTVYFQKFSNGVRVLRVFAPVGILLPPALASRSMMSISATPPSCAAIPSRVMHRSLWEDQLIDKLKSGKTAVFIIFQTEEAGIGIPISLSGFGEALAALK